MLKIECGALCSNSGWNSVSMHNVEFPSLGKVSDRTEKVLLGSSKISIVNDFPRKHLQL